MFGLVSYGVATTAFVTGTALGLGMAGLAAMACRRRRRSDDNWERP